MKIRIECTNHMGSKSYIVKNAEQVSYVGACGTPYALSNLFPGNAILAEFAIADAADDDETFRAILENAPRYGSGPDKGKTTYAFRIVSAGVSVVPALLAALEVAERFISGFEDDELQEGIPSMLATMRAAIAAAKAA